MTCVDEMARRKPAGVDPIDLSLLQRLQPRALASLIRRLVLPFEILLERSAYRPAVIEFTRACDAAEPWYSLGHDPGSVGRLEQEGQEMRGSRVERCLWSAIWSASRAMEFARTGNLQGARSQFRHTFELIGQWESEASLRQPARQLAQQAGKALDRLIKTLPRDGDPPLDGDSMAVPGFYTASRKDETPDETGAEADFEEELAELTRQLTDGRAAVFCGAGISIDSGLPSAWDLRSALLEKLPASERERGWLSDYEIPFEAFLEDLHRHADLKALFGLFAEGKPNAGHRFLARLATADLVTTIVTTNFDELIEQALADQGVPFQVAWRPEDLVAATRGGEGVHVVKLHGTVSDPGSLALLLERVAASHHVLPRAEAIRSLWDSGNHDTVLVLGYSCSDEFDISPAIASISGSGKRVVLVEHAASGWHARPLHTRMRKNPFREFPHGVRLACHTNRLMEKLAAGVSENKASSSEAARIASLGTASAVKPTAEDGLRAFVDAWWRTVPESGRRFTGHQILGDLGYRCGDFRAAKAHYRAALAITAPRFLPMHGGLFPGVDTASQHMVIERASVPPGVRCRALMRVGGCHRALSEYTDALRRFREATELARSAGEQALEAEASTAMGTVFFNTGRFAEAVECHEHGADLFRKRPDQQRNLGTCLANLGNAYGESGRLEEARKSFVEGVEVARGIGDKFGEGSRLGGLGVVYFRQGDLGASEAAHRESLEIATQLGDRSGIGHQLGGLAAVEAEREDFQRAVALAMESAAVFEQVGDRQGMARILGNLGQYCLSAGQAGLGFESLVRSLEIASAIGDPTVLANAQEALGLAIAFCAAAGAPSADTERARTLVEAFRPRSGPDVRELEPVIARLVRFLESRPG
jgi:tetratricopeptide (TPR) repeat protein